MSEAFDWDEANISHLARHKIVPQEAEDVVLSDPVDLEMQLVNGEERQPQIGITRSGRILIVVTTWRRAKIRVVTAFPANSAYKKFYLAQKGAQHGKKNGT